MKVGTFSLVVVLLSVVNLDNCTGEGHLIFIACVREQCTNNASNTSIATQEGCDVMLKCTADSSVADVKILRGGAALNTSKGRVQSIIRAVKCTDSGRYECRDGSGDTEIFDVLLTDCPPRPCPGDEINRTIFVSLNQTVQFTLCAHMYPDIGSHVHFNKTPVRKKKSLTHFWKWDYMKFDEDTQPIPRFIINVSSDPMVVEEYGIVNIQVFSSAGEKYNLNYIILLMPPGGPECPTEVSVTDEGVNDITLSWKPGQDGGAEQSFHILFRGSQEGWYSYKVSGNITSTKLKHLQDNCNYTLRVGSSNEYRPVVNERTCNNTVVAKTKQKPVENLSIFYISLPVSACFLFLSMLLAFFWCRHRAKTRTGLRDENQNTAESFSPQAENHLNQDSYISSEGLKYETVYQVQAINKRKKARKKEKHEKVEYSTIDFTKTGTVLTSN